MLPSFCLYTKKRERKKVAFIRTIKRENPFSQVDRFVFESDSTITYKAKGIMGYILTRPDGWKIRFKDLVNRSKDGREAVTSGLKELEAAGYINYYQERLEKGKFGEWIYDVYERPEFNPNWKGNSPLSENPISGNTNSETPISENTYHSNNKDINNNLSNNNLINNKFKISYERISKVQADLFRNLLRQYLFAEEEIENIIYWIEEENNIPTKAHLKDICEFIRKEEIELLAYEVIALIKTMPDQDQEAAAPTEEEEAVDKELKALFRKKFPKGLHESQVKAIISLYHKNKDQISIYQLQSILDGIGNKIHGKFDNFYYYFKACIDNYLRKSNESDSLPLSSDETKEVEPIPVDELLNLFRI